MITSAKTARKQIPALYQLVKKKYGWSEGTINLDIGGGPWDLFTDALASQGVTNLIYDPYNRSEDHNNAVRSEIGVSQIDTVTIANVLNVIKSREDRKSVLLLAQVAKPKRVYITVYEGSGDSEAGKTRDGWQENRKLDTYLDEVGEVFEGAKIIGKLLVIGRSL